LNLTRRLLKMSRYGAATISTAIKSGDLQIAPTKNNKASEYKTTNDFFDRMSKSETYASADAKGKIERNQKNPEGKKNQWTRKERDPGQKTTVSNEYFANKRPTTLCHSVSVAVYSSFLLRFVFSKNRSPTFLIGCRRKKPSPQQI